MIFKETKYGYWVRVCHGSGPNFRAGTNCRETHELIDKELNWRRTKTEAEKDLDEFAKRHNLEKVKEE